MSTIRTVIADDEELCRKGLRLVLAADPAFEIVAECANGDEAVDAVERLHPDLVFLDIRMPHGSGFDVVRRIPMARMPLIVFVTAFDEYAIQAFKVHAIDYVLKPFTRARFRAAMEHVKARCRDRQAADIGLAMMRMINDWKPLGPEASCHIAPGDRQYLDRVTVGERGSQTWVRVQDIEWIEGADYYVQIHTSERSYLHRERLKNLERQLPPTRFIRVHKSAVVNVDRVERLVTDARRRHQVQMRSGATVPVSRMRQAALVVVLESRATCPAPSQ